MAAIHRTRIARFGIWKRGVRALGGFVVVLALMLCGPLLTLASGGAAMSGDWRTATHRPTGLAPDPGSHPEAIVQVYASRTVGWRGAFAVHTWIAAKAAHADHYTRYEVIGWYARGGGSGVTISDHRAPDAEWYGRAPWLIGDTRGAAAETAVAKLEKVAADYGYTTYRAWPGPNSNTFIAYVGRAIPELHLTMPALAIGKDYLPLGQWVSTTPSGTGYQLSLGGVVGVTAARDEGLEVNLFGLVAGIDFGHPALKFPGVGRIPAGA